jgi:hypothetical protein
LGYVLFIFQSTIDKLNETLNATVLMLKGLEGEKEEKARKDMAGSRAGSEGMGCKADIIWT